MPWFSDWCLGGPDIPQDWSAGEPLGAEPGGLLSQVWQQWLQRWTHGQCLRVRQGEWRHRH